MPIFYHIVLASENLDTLKELIDGIEQSDFAGYQNSEGDYAPGEEGIYPVYPYSAHNENDEEIKLTPEEANG